MCLTVRRWSSETADQPKESLLSKKKCHPFSTWVPSHAVSIAVKGGWRTGRKGTAGQVLTLEAGQRLGAWHGRETLHEAVLGVSIVLRAIPMWTVMSQTWLWICIQTTSRYDSKIIHLKAGWSLGYSTDTCGANFGFGLQRLVHLQSDHR